MVVGVRVMIDRKRLSVHEIIPIFWWDEIIPIFWWDEIIPTFWWDGIIPIYWRDDGGIIPSGQRTVNDDSSFLQLS